MLNEFKIKVNKSKNRNIRFVNVKEDRFCHHCGKLINKSSESLTVNPRYKSRRWFCLKCVELLLQLRLVKVLKNNVAFDDEGAYMAFCDWEAEILEELDD